VSIAVRRLHVIVLRRCDERFDAVLAEIEAAVGIALKGVIDIALSHLI
jgi:hypothetical protein